jgi:hypothetical protein
MGSATNSTMLAGGLQSFFRSLGNPLPLKLGDGRKHMKHQPTGGRGGVDVFGQRPEARAMGLDRVNYVEKVAQRPRKAVILGDSDHIALTQLIEQAVQLGPAAGRAGDLVSKYLLCARRLQGIELAV